MTGQTITHYEVLEKLGGGGMGVVYRARDILLNRYVAVKFLAPELTRNAGAKQRFVQEAQAASALDHSNICTIHEIAETSDGQSFIVMACYEGETLKDRIARGPLKVDDALDIAIGVGSALVAAHECGIVHRDIKPGNVMLTRRGEVKVVDFGLAKLTGEMNVTRTGMTQPGVTVGTVAYMSPEQTLGGVVDQRTDIWALGVVLYEMVSGRRPFDGAQPASILHAVAHETPAPPTSLRTGVPIDLDRIVMRALAKQPDERYQSAADLVSEVKLLRHTTDRVATEAPRAPSVLLRRWTWWSTAVLLLSLGALGGGAAYVLRGHNADRAPTFTNLVQVTSAIGVEDYPTWAPDGRMLAYEGGDGSHVELGANWDIWVAQVGGGAAINRTADHQGSDRFPAWSPDGRQLAFWSSRDGGGCFVMPALAGPPRKIATSGLLNLSRPQWSGDGTKLACVSAPADSPDRVGAEIVSLASGVATTIALPGDGRRFDLAWSRDGRFFAYVSSPGGIGSDVARLMVVRASDGHGVPVTDGQTNVRGPFWSADGRWLYYVTNREGAMDIWRQAVARDATPAGPPTRVTAGMEVLQATLSGDGAKLAYSKGRSIANVWSVPILVDRAVTWADARQVTFDDAMIEFLDLSPDGRTLAVSSDRSGNHDLWLMPADGGEMRPITTDPRPDWDPKWSPDGKQIAFYSHRAGNRDVWILPLDGGPARQLTHDPEADLRAQWSPDGREISYLSGRLGHGGIWIVQATGGEPREIERLANDHAPVWSPDGQWLAFASGRAGGVRRLWRTRIDGSNADQLTKGPAGDPIWSRDGRQLFFPGVAERAGNVWAISLAGRHERPLTALTGRRGNLMPSALATDGQRLFFSWQENTGDIWAMDVIGSRPR